MIYTVYSSCYWWSLGIFLRNSPLHECDKRQYFLFFLYTLILICINTIYNFFCQIFWVFNWIPMNTTVPATGFNATFTLTDAGGNESSPNFNIYILESVVWFSSKDLHSKECDNHMYSEMLVDLQPIKRLDEVSDTIYQRETRVKIFICKFWFISLVVCFTK